MYKHAILQSIKKQVLLGHSCVNIPLVIPTIDVLEYLVVAEEFPTTHVLHAPHLIVADQGK